MKNEDEICPTFEGDHFKKIIATKLFFKEAFLKIICSQRKKIWFMK
jgi:hypothetical protein